MAGAVLVSECPKGEGRVANASQDIASPVVRLVSWNEEMPTFDPIPRPLTSLIGRDHAGEAVRRQLARSDVRLLTLTGTGGIGKSRLAIRAATIAAPDFPNGVVFVHLSPLTDPALVLPTIAQALGIGGPGIRSIEQRVTGLLDGQRLLIVLDNFEHVMPAASEITALLRSTRNATFLVTSRTPLHISGEHEFAVQPLDLPATPNDPVEIARSPAVALFEERTRAVRDDFRVDVSNAATVLEICRRLDGVPLAIELAAARGKALPPNELLRQLARDIDLLSGGPADHPARHRTMRGAIQWSYDLLPPVQQRLFQALSVFAAGCTLDAAELVTASARVSELIDGMTALIDAGLLRLEPQPDGQSRYRMLDLIRRFAIERLQENPEQDEIVQRFANWCVDLAERASTAFQGAGPGVWAETLVREIGNFRSAITLLDARGDQVSVLRLATALAPLWSALGHQREGLHLLTSTLARMGDGSQPEATLPARLLAARLATILDDFPLASDLARSALTDATASDDLAAAADAHCTLGNLARGTGDGLAARAHYAEALAIYRTAGDRYWIGYVLVQLAKLGDFGSPGRPGNPADLAAAEAHCQEGLAIYRELQNLRGIARALNHLGYLQYKSGRFAASAANVGEALRLFRQIGDLSEGAQAIENLADIAGAAGHPDLAARLYGMAEIVQERFGTPMWPVYRAEYEQEVGRVRAQLTPAEMQSAWEAGRNLPEDAVIAEALAASARFAISQPAPPEALPSGLTSREVDVLRLLATGATNPEIAAALFISVTTVKGHVQNIMRKLDLGSRSALAAWAVRRDLGPPS